MCSTPVSVTDPLSALVATCVVPRRPLESLIVSAAAEPLKARVSVPEPPSTRSLPSPEF